MLDGCRFCSSDIDGSIARVRSHVDTEKCPHVVDTRGRNRERQQTLSGLIGVMVVGWSCGARAKRTRTDCGKADGSCLWVAVEDRKALLRTRYQRVECEVKSNSPDAILVKDYDGLGTSPRSVVKVADSRLALVPMASDRPNRKCARIELAVLRPFVERAVVTARFEFPKGTGGQSVVEEDCSVEIYRDARSSAGQSIDSIESKESDMDPGMIVGAITAGLQLVEKLSSVASGLRGQTHQLSKTHTVREDSGVVIRREGNVVKSIDLSRLQLAEWDQMRYDALFKRVSAQWRQFNEIYSRLPELSIDERARLGSRMDSIKEELCRDLRELIRISETVLGVELGDYYSLSSICEGCN
jgi:hypothetical protein